MKRSAEILLFVLGFLFQGFSQSNLCPPLSAGSDMAICAGASSTLSASPGFTAYAWTPATGLSNPFISSPLASPSVTTTYTVTASITAGPNLVVNGNFSQGNTGFVTGHTYSSDYQPCNYYVAPTFFSQADPIYADHTPTADNIYMSIDGCMTAPTVIWQSISIAVDPNTDYTFRFWATRAAVNQPILETSLTGNVTGTAILSTEIGLVPPGNGLMWDEYGFPVWNSGSNTSVVIRITNLETEGYGVDFGLDDIDFHKGCVQTDEVTVTVNPSSPTLDLGPDLGWCTPSTTIIYAGPDFLNYHWSDGSSGQTITVSEPGTYWLTVTNFCDGAIQTDSVVITSLPSPVPDLGSDKAVCPGDSAQLYAGSFSSYHWTGSGMSCTACPNPSVLPGTSGTYTVTVTNQQGCTGSDQVLITMASVPPLELVDVISVCAGDTSWLLAPDGFDFYHWQGSDMSFSESQQTQIIPLVSLTFVLNASTSEGCAARDSLYVNVLPVPVIALGEDITICKGSETSFPYLSPLLGSYAWAGTGLSCYNCSSPEAFPADSTLYVLTVTTAQGCVVRDSINVFVKDDAPQNVMTTVTDAACDHEGTVVIEAVGNGTDELQYNFGQQGFSATPLYESVPIGNYLLSVRNGDDGCPYSGIVVVGGEQHTVYIPNAFTPDGNELNNTWHIEGNCIAEISCRIMDRWGEEIARLADLSQTWDGTSKGVIVQDGIYTYIAEITYSTSKKEVVTGFIAVLR